MFWIFKGRHRTNWQVKWVFFAVIVGRGDSAKLVASRSQLLQPRQGKKHIHQTPAEQCWLINHMLLIEGSPQKQTVTLFWNVAREPLTPRLAFGFGESLTWVGLSLHFRFTVQEAQRTYVTNIYGGGHRGRNKALSSHWIWNAVLKCVWLIECPLIELQQWVYSTRTHTRAHNVTSKLDGRFIKPTDPP